MTYAWPTLPEHIRKGLEVPTGDLGLVSGLEMGKPASIRLVQFLPRDLEPRASVEAQSRTRRRTTMCEDLYQHDGERLSGFGIPYDDSLTDFSADYQHGACPSVGLG